MRNENWTQYSAYLNELLKQSEFLIVDKGNISKIFRLLSSFSCKPALSKNENFT